MTAGPTAAALTTGEPESWEATARRLAAADSYWLATARPDGRPHVMPVLAVLTDDALHFCAAPASRKARNLARVADCVLTAGGADADLVVEGRALQVRDHAALARVAAAYASRYEWHVTVRDGAFHDTAGAPTAGPPPYDVYRLAPSRAFAFPHGEGFVATRWTFGGT